MAASLEGFALTELETEEMHALYRSLHAHPELSMQEHRTQERVEEQLELLGIEHFRCGGTGVAGVIRNGEGPVVGLRADIDGLPIAEDTGLDYASAERGTLPDGTEVPVMHGCGHDTHITAALTAARLLVRETSRWSGTVVLIFQPGEETAAGARAMVDDGLWEKAPRPEIVLGQHVWPGPAGTVSLTRGIAMAMADSLRITVHGRQSHGSQPHNGIDPVVLASSIVLRLQTIVSRELDPLDTAVVTVGTLHAGLKENIIPDRAELTVNIRTFTPEVREQVLAAVERIVQGECETAGAPSADIEKLYDFPANVNDVPSTDRVIQALSAALGEENVREMPPKTGSEDFGWLGEAIGVPTVFWFFGGFDPGAGTPPVNHSPFFAPLIEPTLSTGTRAALAGVLSWAARE